MILLKAEKSEHCSPVTINDFAHQIKKAVLWWAALSRPNKIVQPPSPYPISAAVARLSI